jgi:hypothetical protein
MKRNISVKSTPMHEEFCAPFYAVWLSEGQESSPLIFKLIPEGAELSSQVTPYWKHAAYLDISRDLLPRLLENLFVPRMIRNLAIESKYALRISFHL